MYRISRSLRKELKRAVDALRFAHCGEMLLPRQKARMLAGSSRNNVTPERLVATGTCIKTARKRVLLAAEGGVHSGALNYAVRAAKRFDADIDVLTDMSTDEIGEKLATEFAGDTVGWKTTVLKSDILTAIAEYTARNPSVLFVVTSEKDRLTERYLSAQPATKTVQAPWLVIADELRVA